MGPVHLAERLSRSGPSEIADARHHLCDLVRTARALTAVLAHPRPDAAAWSCSAVACPLADRPQGRELCAAAHRLAAIDVDVPGPLATLGTPGVDDLVGRFESSLIGAVDAVRACRQTAHPSRTCWFHPTGAPTSAHGYCGSVLHLVHQLAGDRPWGYDY